MTQPDFYGNPRALRHEAGSRAAARSAARVGSLARPLEQGRWTVSSARPDGHTRADKIRCSTDAQRGCPSAGRSPRGTPRSTAGSLVIARRSEPRLLALWDSLGSTQPEILSRLPAAYRAPRSTPGSTRSASMGFYSVDPVGHCSDRRALQARSRPKCHGRIRRFGSPETPGKFFRTPRGICRVTYIARLSTRTTDHRRCTRCVAVADRANYTALAKAQWNTPCRHHYDEPAVLRSRVAAAHHRRQLGKGGARSPSGIPLAGDRDRAAKLAVSRSLRHTSADQAPQNTFLSRRSTSRGRANLPHRLHRCTSPRHRVSRRRRRAA